MQTEVRSESALARILEKIAREESIKKYFGNGSCKKLITQITEDIFTMLRKGEIVRDNVWCEHDSPNVILIKNITSVDTVLSASFEYGGQLKFGQVVGIDYKREEVLVSWWNESGNCVSVSLPKDRSISWRSRPCDNIFYKNMVGIA